MSLNTFQLPRRNLTLVQAEAWRPPAFAAPRGACGRCRAWARRLLDLQAASIWRDLKVLLPQVRGEVLDVGCGAQLMSDNNSSPATTIRIPQPRFAGDN
jgi:hypothetical protein